MFGSRQGKRHYSRRLRETLWPRMGWRRAATYYSHRLKRLPGTPYTIAAGFASGAAVSFTPFLGLHFLLGALLALVLRGNLIASAVGTAVGNPWTFWLIWYVIFEVGSFLLGYDPGNAPVELTLNVIIDSPGEILVPMMVGGLVVGPFVWIIAFFLVRRVVRTYQRLREQRRRSAARRRQARRERAAAKKQAAEKSEHGAHP